LSRGHLVEGDSPLQVRLDATTALEEPRQAVPGWRQPSLRSLPVAPRSQADLLNSTESLKGSPGVLGQESDEFATLCATTTTTATTTTAATTTTTATLCATTTATTTATVPAAAAVATTPATATPATTTTTTMRNQTLVTLSSALAPDELGSVAGSANSSSMVPNSSSATTMPSLAIFKTSVRRTTESWHEAAEHGSAEEPTHQLGRSGR